MSKLEILTRASGVALTFMALNAVAPDDAAAQPPRRQPASAARARALRSERRAGRDIQRAMAPPARYFPVSPKPLRMQAGLLRFGLDLGNGESDQHYFQLDDEQPRYLAAKRALLTPGASPSGSMRRISTAPTASCRARRVRPCSARRTETVACASVPSVTALTW